MNDHNGQLVALRDAFSQLRQTIITLSCNLDDKARFKPCPEDKYGTLEDGTRIEFGTSSSPASKHWHAGRVKDAYHACRLAETAACELWLPATPWLSAFAEARGEGTLRHWCNGAVRLLAWTMHRRADRVDEAEAERQLEEVARYWKMLRRLCIYAGVGAAAEANREQGVLKELPPAASDRSKPPVKKKRSGQPPLHPLVANLYDQINAERGRVARRSWRATLSALHGRRDVTDMVAEINKGLPTGVTLSLEGEAGKKLLDRAKSHEHRQQARH